MPETATIQVLGRGTNVDFTIDDTVPYETAARNLRAYLSECRGLYSKGTVSVNVGRRILEAEQLSGIKRILDKESGLTVSRYWCAPEILEDALIHNGEAGTFLPTPVDNSPNEARLPVSDLPAVAVESQEVDSPSAAVAVAPATAEPVSSEPAPVAEQPEQLEGQQLALAIFQPENALPQTGPVENAQAENAPFAINPENAAPEPVEVEPATPEETPDGGNTVSRPPVSAVEETDSEPAPAPAGGLAAATPDTPDTTPDTIEEEPAQAESRADADSTPPYPMAGDRAIGPYRGSEALIIKTTCRSGEVIRYPGDVVVLADVNPGAEIIAGGDIVVLGALRGMAHAGAGGNLKSTIFAMNLESYRLQIGPHIGEAPREVRRAKSTPSAAPKIAYLRRRSIFVAPFVRRYEEYQGGILYEG